MESDCARTEALISSWSQGGSTDTERIEDIRAHLKNCSRCRHRFSALVPLVAYDSERTSEGPGVAELSRRIREDPLPADFVPRVMAMVETTRRPTGFRGRVPAHSASLRMAGLAAAAAAVVVFVGLAFVGPRLVDRGGGSVLVHFVLDDPSATSVALVGNFTKWSPESLKLVRRGNGERWEISVRLKKGETYVYNFVIDGSTWVPDPNREVQIDDGFGGRSSLIQL